MINFLDELILELFRSKLPSVSINFEQPTGKNAEGWGEHQPTLNFFLYDVRENNTLRQHQWQSVSGQNGNGRSQRKRSSFRFDCHYILTAWAENPIDQHRLLSQAVDLLLTYPQFTKENLPKTASIDLKTWMDEQPYSIPAQVGGHDKLTNPAELWSALDNQIRPSISYIATIGINPWNEQPEAPAVTTRRLLLHPRQDIIVGDPELMQIGGRITDETSNAPISNAVLLLTSLDGKTSYHAKTAKNGRYLINGIVPATYTLIASHGQAKAERTIEIETAVPATVHIKTGKNQFDMRIGSQVVRHQHMTPNQAGYIKDAPFLGYEIEPLSKHLPRNGRYTLIRTNSDQPPSAKIPSKDTSDFSFVISYAKNNMEWLHYDLKIKP